MLGSRFSPLIRICTISLSHKENIQLLKLQNELAFSLGYHFRIAVLTYCEMKENPGSNHEGCMLFEHGFELENTANEPRIIYMMLYTESVEDQTDLIAECFCLRKHCIQP